MNAVSITRIGDLLERKKVLGGAIGRPRTALWIGGDDGIAIAEERGAKVTRAAAKGETYDLVFVTGDPARGALDDVVRQAMVHLGDGAHLVVDHGPRGAAKTAPVVMRRAGLDPLWQDGFGTLPCTLTVARKFPEARRLSLTVGMISMNEAGAVGGVIDGIREVCPQAEILLVDSSKDETPKIAEARGARVLRQFPPRGYGPAMTRLLYAATTDVIVTMDCDGTYPADRIRGLHEAIEAGADIVNASRTRERPAAMPLPNYFANRAFAAIAGAVHHFSTTDLHSGMRAYRTSALRGIYAAEQGAALPVELLIVPARHGYRVIDVDIDYFERVGASSLQRWNSTLWTLRRIFRSAVNGGHAVG